MSGARRFWAVSAAVVVVVAGLLSYTASSHPDGLEAATLRGCAVTSPGQRPVGDCIAVHAAEHPLAGAPLAGYAVAGRDSTVGPVGVLGAVVAFGIAVSLFAVIARGRSRART